MNITRRHFLAGIAAAQFPRMALAVAPKALVIDFDPLSSTPAIRITSDGNRVIALLKVAELRPVVERYQSLLQSPKIEGRREIEQLSSALYSILWEPIEKEIADQEVNIQTHGILRNISFDSLKGANGFVGQKYRLRQLVGTRIRGTTRNTQPFSQGTSFVYAPVGSDLTVPELFWSRREAKIVTDKLPAKVRLGKHATKSAFLSDTSRPFSVLHIATHSGLNEQGEQSLALRVPVGSPGAIAWLTAAEIKVRRMQGSRLAVLSACESAVGSSRSMSLAGAFLTGGVIEVLATRWKVDDIATLRFMQAFYDRLALRNDAATAVRFAKASFITSEYDSFQHPHFWAPFTLLSSHVFNHDRQSEMA